MLKKYRAFMFGETYETLIFSEAWARFLDYIIDKNGKTESYINLEKYGRLYILPRLQKKMLNTLGLSDFQACISKARRTSGGSAPLSRRTLRNLKATIMQFIHFAVNNRCAASSIFQLQRPAPSALYCSRRIYRACSRDPHPIIGI